MIVLDANILIRAVMGRRVRLLLEQYSDSQMRFCAPRQPYSDAEKYLPPLLRKRGKLDVDVSAALRYLHHFVEPVDQDSYAAFEGKARERLRGRDEEDWPVLAIALALSCPIWTEDVDFFGSGVAIWTTSRIEIFLKAGTQPPKP